MIVGAVQQRAEPESEGLEMSQSAALRVGVAWCCGALIWLMCIFTAHADPMLEAFDALKKREFVRALQILKPLAGAGNADAEGLLGDMYSQGQGVRQSNADAVLWWRRAALGDAYLTGRGVPKDESQAVAWWRKAAAQNISRAQVGLGLALYRGRGTHENKTEAAQLFAKAASK